MLSAGGWRAVGGTGGAAAEREDEAETFESLKLADAAGAKGERRFELD